jgi:tetratricopeptide (TPR) repeat protein
MPTNLLSQLEQFYNEEPGDPFNLYALALEYQKHDQAKASKLFDKLLSEHPSYVPSYYHAAKLFEQLDERDKAIRTYEKGIEMARKVNDQKTARELRSAYDELVFD